MTLLQIMPDDQAGTVLLCTEDQAVIATALRQHGVSFSRWELSLDPGTRASSAQILSAYAAHVSELSEHGGYRLVDVAQIRPDDAPDWPERAATARKAFRAEHEHDEDEVRFFAAGRGCFYLHLDGQVLAVVCEPGDLLSVPARTRHWFDMGSQPDFAAIRFFQKDDGWVGEFSGSDIAASFPSLDSLLETA